MKLALHYKEALFTEDVIKSLKHKFAADFIVWLRGIIKQINNLHNWPNQRVRNSVLNAWESNENEEYFCLIFSEHFNVYKNLQKYGLQLFLWFQEMLKSIGKRMKKENFLKEKKVLQGF
uniref:Uncharacterized protein n=1 Tax=Meloidogyne enterolobii TaxID=390850 RepID=A0A6V7XEF1_MELEN|nr:unnamed protein product [Meloidogyne enterolobii]